MRQAIKKRLHGIVISDKSQKTRVVKVERLVRHPKYQKPIKKRKMFYVHDEKEISKAGDAVIIIESRPLSKLKRWRILKVKK